jgi:hypothetical protein
VDNLREAFIAAGSACVAPVTLAQLMGATIEEANATLEAMELEGMIAWWDKKKGNGLLVTLSPLGAARLDLALIEVDGKTRWTDGSEPEPSTSIDEEAVRRTRLDWAGSIRLDRSGYPKPTVLLGFDMPWVSAVNGMCPGCGGFCLEETHYCVFCDAWGLDLANRERPAKKRKMQCV